jgi:hypothetical protein
VMETTPAASSGGQPDDPVPDAEAWRHDADPRLHQPDIARLQEAAGQSRERIARRLEAAGMSTPGVPGIDAHRDLDTALEVDVDTLERIDELHGRRTRSASPRERQHATTVLAEALHRIVDGYQVGDPPPSRVVRGLRQFDDVVRRAYARLTLFHAPTPIAERWEPASRWVFLALAAAGAALVAAGHPVAAAAPVVLRVVLAAATAPPPPSATTWRRLIGSNPGWASSVCSHAGDALVLAGLAAGLQASGRPVWAALTMGAALFGVLATMSRIAAREQGLRLPRLWIERATKDVAITGAVLALAMASRGPAAMWALTLVAPAAVGAVGVTELVRTAYYTRRRRRLLSRASGGDGIDGLVPDAIVVTTGDGIVVNLRRSGRRPPIFPDHPSLDRGRTLRVVPASGE